MLGKNDSYYVNFYSEKHEKCPKYFGEAPQNSLITSEKVIKNE